MTKEVKFPGTDVEADPVVYLGPLEEPDVIGVFNLNVVSRGNEHGEVKYLRADTVTPNDKIADMMREVIGRWECHMRDFDDTNTSLTVYQQQMMIVEDVIANFKETP